MCWRHFFFSRDGENGGPAAGIAVGLLGLAVSARFFVILLIAALLWRQRARIWAIFTAVLLAMYLPFAVRGSSDAASVITFASGWEFNSSVFAVLREWFGGTGGRIACAALFLAFYVWGSSGKMREPRWSAATCCWLRSF